MKMRVGFHLSVIVLCLLVSIKHATGSCKIMDNYIEYSNINLKIQEPIQTSEQCCLFIGNYTRINLRIAELHMKSVSGSIGMKTISSFSEAEKLSISSSYIDKFENGTLCSLPHLKSLRILNTDFRSPHSILEKENFTGCGHIERFECEAPLARDALEEMPALKELSLAEVKSSFIRDYLAPLKKIESLSLNNISNLAEHDPGLFCTQSSLKKLSIRIRAQIFLDDLFFHGCKSSSTGSYEANPFEEPHSISDNPDLEYMKLQACIIDHFDEDLLKPFPNLKTLEILADDDDCRLNIDENAFVNTPKITRLTLSHVHLRDTELNFLHNLTHLVALDLSRNEIQNLDVLPSLPKLTLLYIPDNKIVRFDLHVFKQKFPRLQWLFIGNNQLDEVFGKELYGESTFSVFK